MKYNEKCMLEFYDDVSQVLKKLKREAKILKDNYLYSYKLERVSEKDTNTYKEKARCLDKTLDSAISLSNALDRMFRVTDDIADRNNDRNDFFVVKIK